MQSSFDFMGNYDPLSEEPKHWEAADIFVRNEGRWMAFFDHKGGVQLNLPRSVDPHYKVSYKAKERKIEGFKSENKDIWPKQVNYTSFRAKPLRSARFIRKDRLANTQIPYIPPIPAPAFKGNRPILTPHRMSSILINKKRQEEKILYSQTMTPRYTIRAPIVPKKSLFERSLRRRESDVVFDDIIEENAKKIYDQE